MDELKSRCRGVRSMPLASEARVVTVRDVGSSGAMHGDSARGGMALEWCEGETSRYETARVRSRLMTYPEERSESQQARTNERNFGCDCVPKR